MSVIIRMSTGDTYRLDRNLNTYDVTRTINDKRGTGKLIEFQDNATPSRAIYIDPDHVIAITNDGHSY